MRMPCPKCQGILIREDGVVYCEDCLHVVERRGDPKFDKKVHYWDAVPKREPKVVPKETVFHWKPRPKPKPKPKPKLRPITGKRAYHIDAASGRRVRGKGLWEQQPAKGLFCDCGRPMFAKGKCKRCYNRKWERERFKRSSKTWRRLKDETPKLCSCGRKHFARGYCRRCYTRYVAVTPNHTKDAQLGQRKCNLCNKIHYAKGLCKRHYEMSRLTSFIY